MKAFTYFEKVFGGGDWEETVEIWRNSWASNGWEPVVLTRKDAETHHDFESFSKAIRNHPKVNHSEFQRSAFFRHLAFAKVEGLCMDFDVINRNFKPEDLIKVIQGHDIFSLYEEHASPCTHWATLAARDAIVRIFKWWDGERSKRKYGLTGCSDMNIFMHFSIPFEKIVYRRNEEGWQTAALVHFNRLHTHYNKPQAIREAGLAS